MTVEDEALQATDTLADLARDLPNEVLLFLVRNAPTREVWKWLGENSRLQYELARGFQSTANSLRQPVVRNRFVQHLRSEPESFDKLLSLWAETSPPPHVVAEIAELDDEALSGALVALWQQHGGEALLLALLQAKREAALDAYATLDPTKFDEEEPVTPNESAPTENAAPAPEPAQQHNPELEVELSRARSEAQKLRAQLDPLQTELANQRQKHLREVQALKLKLKQDEHKRAALEQELSESKKTLDRTSRRQRHAEKELEEVSAETKRLKRQLRQSQQLHEELRKQNAALVARLPQVAVTEPAPAPKKAKAPAAPPVKVLTPLDQQFVWKSDGRQFRVTPREVGRAIDRNDEEFIFTLIQAFEALREMNLAGYKLFIERIRELGRYYVRVLTADTTRVLIDASNVARYEKDRYGKGQFKHLLSMRDELRLRDCFPIFSYADASLIYNIDEPAELAAMAKRAEIEIVPAGTEADEILAREARRSGAYVVTNDRNFFSKVTPDFEPPRISFRIIDGHLIIDDF